MPVDTSKLQTLDELIETLENLKTLHGGSTYVGITSYPPNDTPVEKYETMIDFSPCEPKLEKHPQDKNMKIINLE